MSDPIQQLVQQLRGPLSAEFLSVEAIKRGGGGYRIGFIPRDVLQPYTANGTVLIGVISRSITLVQLAVGVYVNTTNNSSNYWTVTLSVLSGGNLASISTSLISANSGSVGFVALSGTYSNTDVFFQIAVTKTGSPGSLYMAAEVYGI